MTELIFVDTNVLVYSRDSSEREKQPLAEAWRRSLWKSRTGRLSTQVLQEYYQVITRKLRPGMPRQQARDEVGDLGMWHPVSITPGVLRAAWEIEDRFDLTFWDSLIVAAAHESGCTYLLSEDFGEAADLGGVVVVNPFHTAPEKLISEKASPRRR